MFVIYSLPPFTPSCSKEMYSQRDEKRKWGTAVTPGCLEQGRFSKPAGRRIGYYTSVCLARHTTLGGDAGTCCSLSSETSLRLLKHLAARLSYISPGKRTICLPVAAFEWRLRQHMAERSHKPILMCSLLYRTPAEMSLWKTVRTGIATSCHLQYM